MAKAKNTTDQKNKPGAPPCGLYYRITSDEQINTLKQRINQIALVINRSSRYEKNMDVIEIVPDGFSISALQSLIELIKNHGLVALIYGDIEITNTADADGVVLHTPKEHNKARSTLGEDAIVGIHCLNLRDHMNDALEQEADFILIGTYGYGMPDTHLIEDWAQQTKKLCAALGDIDNDTAGLLAKSGTSFVEVTRYVNNHEQGTMQAIVNVLYALELADNDNKPA